MKYLLVFFLSLIPLTSFGESRTEVMLNLGILNGGGSDGDFPLDGDLDSWEIVGKHHFSNHLMVELGYQSRNGEYTLTDGQDTDYDADELKLKIGYQLCDAEDCLVEITPYTGYIRFDAENDLNAFGVDISVDQEVTKVPLGIEVWGYSGAWSYGADLSMAYKSKDEQKIDVLAVDQESESNWSFEISIPVRYQINERIFLEGRFIHTRDEFEDEVGNREAEEKNNQFTLGVGVKL